MMNQLKMLQYCMCQLFFKSLLHSHATVSQSHLTPTAISSNKNFSTNTYNCQLCFWFVLIFTFHMQPSTDSEHYNTWQLMSNRSHLQPCSSLPLSQCDRLQFTQYLNTNTLQFTNLKQVTLKTYSVEETTAHLVPKLHLQTEQTTNSMFWHP